MLTVDAQVRRLGVSELEKPVHALDKLQVPAHFNPRNAKSRRDLAATLRIKVPDDAHLRHKSTEAADEAMDEATAAELHELRAAMKRHPCHQCPEREDHARWAARWWKLRAESDDLQRKISGRTNTVARTLIGSVTCCPSWDTSAKTGDRSLKKAKNCAASTPSKIS
ncbi:hypothetical protein [Ornithinimicrobium sp. INDO-MA30-4]|uniref:hypothetical protein n=1 Tax=Ornithinimicrobium sp. INDO-MA30-4 TaxID=2908651 RepID=UPI001F439F61|nr:hypothetical protein [Ornithinimicrobium sp. INDO-MA30-4]UJH71080.1 hypothetical protein L0A91_04145 [Ornithinimicrobium sp. INDO-MA30-4]